MNLLSIASSLERLGRSERWEQPRAILKELDESMERLEIWYVLRFGRKVPPQPMQIQAPPDLRLELLSVAHTLSNLEIAINMGLAEQDRCQNIALEVLHNLRAIRSGIQHMQQGQSNGLGMQAGA